MKASQIKELLKNYNWEGQGEFLRDCLLQLIYDEHYRCEDLYYQLIDDRYNELEELLEKFDDYTSIAKAIHYGNIKSFDDDYFFLDELGNVVSQSEYEYFRDFEEHGEDILKEMIEYCINDNKLKNIKNVDELIEYIKKNVL